MRRGMLLALLAMGVSTAAFASSVDYDSGNFQNGTFTGNLTTTIDFTVTGTDNTISITTGQLSAASPCSTGEMCRSFSTGMVTVTNSSGTVVFSDSLQNGTITDFKGAFQLGAFLVANSSVGTGVVTTDWILKNGAVTTGSANVSVSSAVVPEPGTLGLLGTGLIGLAFMAKRKLKLPI